MKFLGKLRFCLLSQPLADLLEHIVCCDKLRPHRKARCERNDKSLRIMVLGAD